MSETEFLTGKLTFVGPKGSEILEDAAIRILTTENYEMSEYDETALDVIKDKFTYTYVVVADKIYKVEMEDKEDNEDIFEASRESDGTISFTVKYYNGGCGFNEAIEEAFKLMDVKKAKV